jgi:DNA-binding transcriptional regulator YiaG
MTADELKAWRERYRTSQRELARLLDVHAETVSRWERGTIPIPRTTELALEALAPQLRAAVSLPPQAGRWSVA